MGVLLFSFIFSALCLGGIILAVLPLERPSPLPLEFCVSKIFTTFPYELHFALPFALCENRIIPVALPLKLPSALPLALCVSGIIPAVLPFALPTALPFAL